MFLIRKSDKNSNFSTKIKVDITKLDKIEAMGLYAYCVDTYEKFGDIKYQAINIINKHFELTQEIKDSWSRHGQMTKMYLEMSLKESKLSWD